jgi:glycosyltransferase involved in cell wall biosynthesis
VYNVPERFYRACLQSLFIQKIDDVEFIIVNDGSTRPYCEEIAKEYLAKDVRFRYFYKDNGGVSSARNLGIEHSRGEYLMFVDCDDVISPDGCEYVMRDVEEALYDCVLYRHVDGNMENFPKKQAPSRRVVVSKEEREKMVFNLLGQTCEMYRKDNFGIGPCWSKIYRKSAIEQNDLKFNTAFSPCEDLLFNMEFFTKCQSLLMDSHCIYVYVNNNESVVRSVSDRIVRVLPSICKAFSSFARKEGLTDINCQRQIGFLVRLYTIEAEWHYFFFKRGGGLSVAKEYSRFLRNPIQRKYLKLLLTDRRLSYKERLAVLIRTTPLCVPFMVINRMRVKAVAG